MAILAGLLCTSQAWAVPAPTAYFSFDEGAGGSATDQKGGPSGALVGGTISWIGGHTGGAGDFAVNFGVTNDGNAVNVPTGAFAGNAVANDAIAFSFWQLNPTAAAADESSFWALSPTAAADARGAQGHVPWGNGHIYWDTSGCCGGNQRIEQLSPASNYDAMWHHWVFQKAGNGRKEIWVDGTLFLGVDNAAAESLEVFTGLNIGAGFTNQNSFSGYIDDFAVYDQFLSVADIQALAGGANVIPEPLTPALLLLGAGAIGLARRRSAV